MTSRALSFVLSRPLFHTTRRTITSTAATAPARPPAASDAHHFTQGASVHFWRHHVPVTPSTLLPRLSTLLSALPSTLPPTHSALSHTFHFAARTLFHLSLSVAGLLATAPTPPDAARALVARNYPAALEEALLVFRHDRHRVRAGVYRTPWDASLAHRERNPLYAASQAARAAAEGAGILRRRHDRAGDNPVWLEGDMYPQYYREPFHFQTDGWLSSASADAYEVLTEALFLGRQDAMQRLTLVPLSDFLGRPRADAAAGRNTRVVELGAGTGRFATFVRDNWPRLDYVLTELSPFYLEKARENMRYWERTAGRRRGRLGNVRYVQAQAEKLPLRDGEADVVYSVYLFHELPPHARRSVFAEAARVLRPGGLFVITDSVQIGDRLALDERLGLFGQFNEPWYESYVEEDFVKLATEEDAFVPLSKEVCSVTKMLSFLRR